MTKKLIAHIKEVATGYKDYVYQYTDGSMFYVTDGSRAVRYKDEIKELPEISVNAHAGNMINLLKRKIDESINTVMYQLPAKAEIKSNITNLAGRSYSTKVAYGNDKFTVNARYLLKAMDALNASVCYIYEHHSNQNGIYLYNNDDPQSDIIEIIMPLRKSSNSHDSEFWIA